MLLLLQLAVLLRKLYGLMLGTFHFMALDHKLLSTALSLIQQQQQRRQASQ